MSKVKNCSDSYQQQTSSFGFNHAAISSGFRSNLYNSSNGCILGDSAMGLGHGLRPTLSSLQEQRLTEESSHDGNTQMNSLTMQENTNMDNSASKQSCHGLQVHGQPDHGSTNAYAFSNSGHPSSVYQMTKRRPMANQPWTSSFFQRPSVASHSNASSMYDLGHNDILLNPGSTDSIAQENSNGMQTDSKGEKQ